MNRCLFQANRICQPRLYPLDLCRLRIQQGVKFLPPSHNFPWLALPLSYSSVVYWTSWCLLWIRVPVYRRYKHLRLHHRQNLFLPTCMAQFWFPWSRWISCCHLRHILPKSSIRLLAYQFCHLTVSLKENLNLNQSLLSHMRYWNPNCYHISSRWRNSSIKSAHGLCCPGNWTWRLPSYLRT